MENINISDIAKIIDGKLTKCSGGRISYVVIDSRKVLFARESLFFALKGTRNDGHLFIEDLYQVGVRNFVVEHLPENYETKLPRANFLQVDNSFVALQSIAQWYRSQFNIPIVGITGSNGKTITKEWIYQCLEKETNITRNPKSFNSQVGVPLSVMLLNKNTEIGVFEAGISQIGEMSVLQKIINPSIGVFTNIGDAHQENFTSYQQKIEEKVRLFANCKIIVYCADYKEVEDEIMRQKSPDTQLFCWSKNPNTNANIKITNISTEKYSTSIQAEYNSKNISFNIPFKVKSSVENAMNTICTLLVLGLDLQIIQNRIARLENVGMRLELKEGINNCTIINDSYNSDLESLRIALDFMQYQNQHTSKVLILSDIVQSGFSDKDLYRHVSVMVKHKNIDVLIGIGTKIQQYQQLFDMRKVFFETTQEFIQKFSFSKISDAVILLKGARSFTFENISNILQKQSHRTVMDIDLNAIETNINYFKSRLKPQTGIIAMLKASSYGNGIFEIANLCQYQRISAIGVAFPDEGVELRKGGIKLPILVMNPEEDNFKTMFEYGLEPQIYNFNSLRKVNKLAKKVENKIYPVHIKLDTGMHRSGFMSDEIDWLISELQEMNNIRVSTVFSHLAVADEPEQDEFTLQQLNLFDEMSKKLQQALPYKIKRHILNSAGIERFPKYQFDMVRLGIGMYGVSSINKPLHQVGTLKSAIAQIKTLKAGDTIGYGRKGVAKQNTVIATVPIGYADGLRRSLSNGKGAFWVNGKLAPIIGNVCMDICMIDITDISAKEGDSVEVFGKHIPLQTIAEQMDTIPYEVLTSISKRVKRVYLAE